MERNAAAGPACGKFDEATETTLAFCGMAGLVIDDPLPLSFPPLPQQAFFNLREKLVKPLFCPIHFRFVKLNFGL
jgi:hypothetical protein